MLVSVSEMRSTMSIFPALYGAATSAFSVLGRAVIGPLCFLRRESAKCVSLFQSVINLAGYAGFIVLIQQP